MIIFLIFPVHLFENIDLIKNINPDIIYLLEEDTYFNKFKFNKIKLCYHRATMKYYENYLNKNFNVKYIDSNKLKWNKIINNKIKEIHYYDPIDHDLTEFIINYSNKYKIDNLKYNNPNFMETIEELNEYREKHTNKKNYYHDNSFYKWQRKRLNILINNNKPLYGKWSFDKENRQKFDSTYIEPNIQKYYSKYWNDAIIYINKNWPNNFGILSNYSLFPLTFIQNSKHFDNFIKYKLINFGKYEDAVSDKTLFGSHSLLSASLNVGLISVSYIINKIISYFNSHNNKKLIINSIEGFIRQIIGWRSYTRFIYHFHGKEMIKMNLLDNKNKLSAAWFDTTKSTGFTFIDNLIKKTEKYAYLHHIERLMYIGNYALLTFIKPYEIYKWFMICFIDSYEWVMIPNVMGMSQYSLKNISMMSKPYFSSSAYLKRMSNFSSIEIVLNNIKYKWEYIWNSLYYYFIYINKNLLKKNYSTAIQVKNWDKLSDTEKQSIKHISKLYLLKYI
jgi:deoxyribodipyrimidine photolyase-related protein